MTQIGEILRPVLTVDENGNFEERPVFDFFTNPFFSVIIFVNFHMNSSLYFTYTVS